LFSFRPIVQLLIKAVIPQQRDLLIVIGLGGLTTITMCTWRYENLTYIHWIQNCWM